MLAICKTSRDLAHDRLIALFDHTGIKTRPFTHRRPLAAPRITARSPASCRRRDGGILTVLGMFTIYLPSDAV
jgi:hypothetical protein